MKDTEVVAVKGGGLLRWDKEVLIDLGILTCDLDFSVFVILGLSHNTVLGCLLEIWTYVSPILFSHPIPCTNSKLDAHELLFLILSVLLSGKTRLR